MKTYKIVDPADMEQFKDDFGYKVNGNLDIDCSLDFKGRLLVDGFLSIKAGESIEAGGSIKAGESYGISAGLQIVCKNTLSFGLKCFAGICVWRAISDEEKTITCEEVKGGGTIGYGILKEGKKSG